MRVCVCVCCSTHVAPVEGALGLVGGAVVNGAVEGPLIEHRSHVTVWRQRRPQLGVHLPCVSGVRAVKACRDKTQALPRRFHR